jgi:hypothetical protein
MDRIKNKDAGRSSLVAGKLKMDNGKWKIESGTSQAAEGFENDIGTTDPSTSSG